MTLCLDTYALIEIHKENKNYLEVLNKEFVITSAILAEFFNVMYKMHDEITANYWLKKLRPFHVDVNMNIWLKAVMYKYKKKKEKLSIFDCIGYVYAQENNLLFVTGDKEFKGKKGVLYLN